MTPDHFPILCIEDDHDTCELVTFVFNHAGRTIETCSELDCLNLIYQEKFSAIILDNHFHGQRGSDLCTKIRNFDPSIPIIFFSGEARPAEIDKALKSGANAYLTKPDGFDQLVPTTINLIEQSQFKA